MTAATPARLLTGPVALEVLRFGSPLALGMGLQTAFNLVDAYLIGRLPPGVAGPALGAVGICDQLVALGTIVSYGISTATGALLSRKQGEGDTVAVERIAWQSLLLVAALSVVLGLVGILGGDALVTGVVGAKGRVAELGVAYLRVMMGGSFTIFFLLHLTTIQRALGSSKTPALLLVASNVLNLVLAATLIYGAGPAPRVFGWATAIAAALGLPRMELMGAAWGTVLARLLVLLPLTVLVMRRFKLFRHGARERPDRALLTAIARVAWPSSAQLVVRIAAMLLTHSLAARAFTSEDDQSVTTSLGIVFRLETMALFVGLGWGSAAQTFVGLSLGAGRPDRARASGLWAAFYDALAMAALALCYGIWGGAMVAFFDDRPDVIATAQSYVTTVAPSYVTLGVGLVLGAAMQGAAATRLTLALDSLVVVFVQFPLSIAAVFAAGATPARLWLAVSVTYVAFAVVNGLAYRRAAFLRGPAVQ